MTENYSSGVWVLLHPERDLHKSWQFPYAWILKVYCSMRVLKRTMTADAPWMQERFGTAHIYQTWLPWRKATAKTQQQIRSLHLLSTTERYVAEGASLSCGFKFLRNCSYHPTAHNLQFSTLTPLSSVIEFLVKYKGWDPTGLIDSDFWSDPTAACRAFFWKQSLSFVCLQHYTLTPTALFWHLFFQMHSKTLEQNYTHKIPFQFHMR
jgi:hypothetical protein